MTTSCEIIAFKWPWKSKPKTFNISKKSDFGYTIPVFWRICRWQSSRDVGIQKDGTKGYKSPGRAPGPDCPARPCPLESLGRNNPARLSSLGRAWDLQPLVPVILNTRFFHTGYWNPLLQYFWAYANFYIRLSSENSLRKYLVRK